MAERASEDLSWADADDPFNFLVAILEIKKAVDSGDRYSYESNLPIALDATNSGTQILAGLSLDEDAGKHCNLTDDEERGDLYLYIADSLSAFKSHDYWSKHGDSKRKLCKRSVMTYNYSCGAKTMGEHIWNDFRTEREFQGMTKRDCNELGNQIHQACRKMMPGPTKLMDSFIELGLKGYYDGDQYTLDFANGFRLHQNYTHDRSAQVSCRFNGEKINFRLIVEKGVKMDYRKIKNAIAPNIVHGIDAQLVSKMIRNTDYTVSTIHDSFSTHASDAGYLWEDTRAQFIRVLQEVNIPGIEIDKGDLDLNLIQDNPFCFS